MNKSQIRKKILRIRKKNNFKKLKINFKSLLEIFESKNIKGKNIGGYYPYNYEVDVIEILKEFEKKKYLISLPKIKDNFQMDFFEWSFYNPLVINEYGIPEPVSNKIRYPDVLLVPLVAFDNELNRIGYGGGFYDRYLERIEKNKKVIKIGCAFSFQKINKLPIENYDKKLDLIITEKKIII